MYHSIKISTKLCISRFCYYKLTFVNVFCQTKERKKLLVYSEFLPPKRKEKFCIKPFLISSLPVFIFDVLLRFVRLFDKRSVA